MAFDIYQEVTNRIMAQMSQGVLPWQKMWKGGNSKQRAYNRFSKKQYSLINQLMLLHTGEYGSYKQWSGIGGKPLKGTSEIVVFWKMIPVEEEDDDGKKVKKTIPYLKYINVWHVSNVEGVEPKEVEEDDFVPTQHQACEKAEEIIGLYDEREVSLKIEDLFSDEAYYSPSQDYVCVPQREQYKHIEEYYSTKFHELVHSTGHSSRLNRFKPEQKLASFGSQDYSREELVAEIGSAFLLAICGIDTEAVSKNNTAYIQNWLTALKNDKKMIVWASGRAEKAVDFILYGKDGKPQEAPEEPVMA